MEINNCMDTIDSRDIIKRLEELESDVFILDDEIKELNLEEDDSNNEEIKDKQIEIEELQKELDILKYVQEQAEPYCSDWSFGETLIKDSYFPEYAEELARDIGAISYGDSWPLNCIDWEKATEQLKLDYIQVEFDEEYYWIRSN